MFLTWGPELTLLYNDSYVPILGGKHPRALGAAFRDVWSENWEEIRALTEQALGGEATWLENQHFVVNRNGYPEDAWYTFSYSPLRDDDGQVAGMFCAVTETTAQVMADRRREADAARQRRMFEQAPGFICILNGPEHVFEFANEAHFRLVGRRNVIGKAIREAMPDLEGQGFFELLDRVYATGERFTAGDVAVSMVLEAGGAPVEQFVDFIYEPLLDDAGKATGIFVEGHDVTEAHRGREALRANEAFLRGILQSSADCIKVLDLEGRVEFLSEGGMFVMEVDDFAALKGKCWPDLWEGEEHERSMQAVNVAKGGGTGRFQGFARTMKGSPRWWDVIVTPIAGPDGQPLKLLSISRDVTASRRAEEAVRELNATLEERVAARTSERDSLASIVEATDVMVMALDLDYGILATNKANADEFERIYGVRPKAGDNVLDVLAHRPDDQAKVRAGWGRGLAGEEITFVEDYGDPERERPYYEIKFRPLRDASGERVGAYQFVTDVTPRLRAQAELLAVQDALRQSQKMDAMGHLTGGVAHDFNNLLTPIMGSLDMLVRRGLGSERERRLIDGALQSAERAKVLVQRLLAFARRQPLQPVAVTSESWSITWRAWSAARSGPASKSELRSPTICRPPWPIPTSLKWPF
jgi:PAS domain S-box-containing protein